MWYHAHYRIGGEGHLCQGRSRSFPIQDDDHFLVVCRYVERNALRARLVQRAEQWPWDSLWQWLQQPEPQLVLLTTWPMARLPNWVQRVDASQSERELTAVRRCIARGSPSGSDDWIVAIVQRPGLESTLRPRGRPAKTEKES